MIGALKPIIAPYTTNEEAFGKLTEETDFMRDLQINSANLVDIVLDIEDQFGIVIENSDMERMLNIGAAVEIIESKLQEK